jgi:hypothetical protein
MDPPDLKVQHAQQAFQLGAWEEHTCLAAWEERRCEADGIECYKIAKQK